MGFDMIGVFMFAIGSIVGSFLNVCIVRLPHEQSIVVPRSHCVHCKKMIPWVDNIPFFSYLILRGRCRSCNEKISARYFLVELITALTFLGFYWHYGATILLLPYLVMVACFIVATFVDFEHRIIPDEVSMGGVIIGLIMSIFVVDLHDVQSHTLHWGSIVFAWLVVLAIVLYLITLLLPKLKDETEDDEKKELTWLDKVFIFIVPLSIVVVLVLQFVYLPNNFSKSLISLRASTIGYLVGGTTIYVMGLFGNVVFRKESMGGGDVKLMAMIGAFMGWQMALLAFFIAPFFGAVYGLIEKIRTKDSHIAYGPFLVLGALICLFWGDSIIIWIMSGYGLY